LTAAIDAAIRAGETGWAILMPGLDIYETSAAEAAKLPCGFRETGSWCCSVGRVPGRVLLNSCSFWGSGQWQVANSSPSEAETLFLAGRAASDVSRSKY
jgi:hypothetical protein